MNYLRITLICSFLFILSLAGFSQTQSSGWGAAFNTFKIDSKFSVHFDGQVRSNNQWQQIQTILLRPGLNYHINKRMTATTGYAYVRNKRTVGLASGYATEHRIWEQFLFTHPVNVSVVKGNKTSLSHRLRLEQRFLPRSFADHSGGSVELKNSGNDFANRIRYFFRTITPLTKGDQGSKWVFLALQNEVFLNLGDNSVVNDRVFDQNRAYIAVGYRFSGSFDAEMGYMNQYIQGRGHGFTNNHIVQLATYVRL